MLSILGKRLLLALALTCGAAFSQSIPIIAAASDLKFALDDIARDFRASTGKAVTINYGSSGNFYRQITQGAPFELFLSADEDFVYRLSDRGLTVDRGALYATGRIVIFVPPGSPVSPDEGMRALTRAVQQGQVTRFAIANPEHAPYGRAAMQALQTIGLWEQIRPKLVLGENVSQAAQFATSGSTQGGIFAYSLALAPVFAGKGTYALIPQDLHQPLQQRMVLTRKATPVAREFFGYLQQPAARAVFRRYGFFLPGEGGR
jgi:molybdate transport system substrate-binding protein